MKNLIKKNYKKLVMKLPHVRDMKVELTSFHNALPFPPEHFHSPLNAWNELKKKKRKYIFNKERKLEGIKLNLDKQIVLLEEFKKYYTELPFQENKTVKLRFYYDNEFYPYSDAVFLFCVLRHFQPKQIVEVGSGFSSALILDTNSLFFSESIDLTFVEPFPNRLKSLINANDKINLIEEHVQDVDSSIFTRLTENDILLIDSSHVVKTDHDLNYLIFEILPKLKNGVLIHFHDIFYPFEYPQSWILKERISWNEIYFLRAFLMYNNSFKIKLFNSYLERKRKDWFLENMPLCLKQTKTFSGSLWLEKYV